MFSSKLGIYSLMALMGVAAAMPSSMFVNSQASRFAGYLTTCRPSEQIDSIAPAARWTVTFFSGSCNRTTAPFDQLSNNDVLPQNCTAFPSPDGGAATLVEYLNGGSARKLTLFKNDVCSGTGKDVPNTSCTDARGFGFWKVE